MQIFNGKIKDEIEKCIEHFPISNQIHLCWRSMMTNLNISKFCACCKTTKITDLFYKNRSTKDGLSSLCKVCVNASNKPSSERFVKKLNESGKRYTFNQKHALRYKYGLEIEDYNRLLNQQNGECAICQKKSVKPLCVDHCHKTMKVRGLLCNSCNVALGRFGDSVEGLQKAINYLEGK